LSRADKDKDAPLTLRISFPNPIRPYCLAFAEPEEKDVFNVFAITSNREIYTLNVSGALFVRTAATEVPVKDWCKIHVEPGFGWSYPWRMVAESAKALLISVHDGAIIRLHKDSDDRWDKTYYREGGWKKTIRGFVPFQSHQTELFNGMELELSSAIDMAPSPDGQHIWSVGMNHTLRSRTKGEDYGGAELDLVAGHVRNLHTATQPRIPPTQSQLLQILNVQGSYDSDHYGYHSEMQQTPPEAFAMYMTTYHSCLQ
ncbi:hypothetical protein LTS18_001465, partial [Coniosporium uncinatum]